MPFYSVSFLVFFTLFFLLYWFVFQRRILWQNVLLLTGSAVFYAYWDWRYLFLLMGTSVCIYALAKALDKKRESSWRPWILALGLSVCLLPLLIYKYLGFFAALFNQEHLGISQLVLPLGISFYTFRLVSYLLDVDKAKITAEKNALVFLNYVTFFPSMVAGPIDRAAALLPQISTARVFDYDVASDGSRQILWGLFKKMVIANNLALLVNAVFDNSTHLPGSTLLLTSFLYSIQIYADFSGYSDMAIGIAKLLGFRLQPNFNYPFFSKNIAEFWRRWHISLSSFTTDYIFTPLNIAVRHWNKAGLFMALFLNFLIIGLWHGANATFVVFGLLHAVYFIPLIIRGTVNKVMKKNQERLGLSGAFSMLLLFVMVSVAFVFFRSPRLDFAGNYLRNIVSTGLFSWPEFPQCNSNITLVMFAACLMLVVEWRQRSYEHGLYVHRQTMLASTGLGVVLRWTAYVTLMLLVFALQGNEQEFIYFGF